MSDQDRVDPPRTFERVEPRDLTPHDEVFGSAFFFRFAARLIASMIFLGLVFVLTKLFDLSHRSTVNIAAGALIGVAVLVWLIAHFLPDRDATRRGD